MILDARDIFRGGYFGDSLPHSHAHQQNPLSKSRFGDAHRVDRRTRKNVGLERRLKCYLDLITLFPRRCPSIRIGNADRRYLYAFPIVYQPPQHLINDGHTHVSVYFSTLDFSRCCFTSLQRTQFAKSMAS